MKLYLHNFLQDNIDATTHYPLKIIPGEVQIVSVDFNPDLITSFIRRIDMMALEAACRDVGIEFAVPENLSDLEEDQLKMIHHVLFEVEVVSGELVSPSERHFPIISGIPDMCPHIGAPQEPEQQQQPQEE